MGKEIEVPIPVLSQEFPQPWDRILRVSLASLLKNPNKPNPIKKKNKTTKTCPIAGAGDGKMTEVVSEEQKL